MRGPDCDTLHPDIQLIASPLVLLQGLNLRGSLLFIAPSLKPAGIPASVVREELVRRQQKAAFIQPRSVDVRSFPLAVGQPVRALIKNKGLPGVVSVVCPEPNSYVVRLSDGRLFRRTCWAINISAIDSNLSPVRSCFHRPQAVDIAAVPTPVVRRAATFPVVAPLSVSKPAPAPTTVHPSSTSGTSGPLSVVRQQDSMATPIN